VQEQVRALTKAERRLLAAEGLRIGRDSLFLPHLLRGAPNRWRLALWRLFYGGVAAPEQRAPALPAPRDADAAWYRVCGYLLAGEHAIRVDRWEAFAAAVAKNARANGALVVSAELAAAAGVDAAAVPGLLRRLRFFPTATANESGDLLYGPQGRAKAAKPGRAAKAGQTQDPATAGNADTKPGKPRRRPSKQQPPKPRPEQQQVASPDSPFAGLRTALALAAAS
jgi:ATP-dependent RNA helicase SUPV3L1/SUV3